MEGGALVTIVRFRGYATLHLSVRYFAIIWVLATLLTGCSLLFQVDAADMTVPDSGSMADAGDTSCFKRDEECPTSWQSFEGSCSCYRSGFRGSPAKAYDICAAASSHLLVIETTTEQDAVQDHLLNGGDTDFHLGLFHNSTGWEWVTGDLLAETGFSGFADGVIPILNEDRRCTQFNQQDDGLWVTKSCENDDGIVCELDGKLMQSKPQPYDNPY